MGLMSGLGIGLLFIAPWIAMNVAYAMRPRALAIIDGGYAVVGCGVIRLVLGIFKKNGGFRPPGTLLTPRVPKHHTRSDIVGPGRTSLGLKLRGFAIPNKLKILTF